jgi:hypothetical protein
MNSLRAEEEFITAAFRGAAMLVTVAFGCGQSSVPSTSVLKPDECVKIDLFAKCEIPS